MVKHSRAFLIYNVKHDVIKRLRAEDSQGSKLDADVVGLWADKSTTAVKEFWGPEFIELSLPSLRIGFFDVLFKKFIKTKVQTMIVKDWFS